MLECARMVGKPTIPQGWMQRGALWALLAFLCLGLSSCGALNSLGNAVKSAARLPSQVVNSVVP